MKAKIEELKNMVKSKHPLIDFDEYSILDHQDGRCDYDPYERYDAEWKDESESFGHMHSEDLGGEYPTGFEGTYPADEDLSIDDSYLYEDDQPEDHEDHYGDSYDGDYEPAHDSYDDETDPYQTYEPEETYNEPNDDDYGQPHHEYNDDSYQPSYDDNSDFEHEDF